MKILDMSAGRRAQWVNKAHPDCTYVDIREEIRVHPERSSGGSAPIRPDVVCDTGSMPFEDNTFDLLSFDPPHMRLGPNSHMGALYGSFTTAEILDTVRRTAPEAWRVAKPDAFLTLKWNDHDIKVTKVFELLNPWWEVLYGQSTNGRLKHPSNTTWHIFRRRLEKLNG